MGGKKLKKSDIFTYDEKRNFIQTLLIIGGLLAAFNYTLNNTTIFVIFIISSLMYLIFISINERKSSKLKNKGRKFFEVYYTLLPCSVGFSFSGLIAIITIPDLLKTGLIGIIFLFALYAMLGFILSFVLSIKKK